MDDKQNNPSKIDDKQNNPGSDDSAPTGSRETQPASSSGARPKEPRSNCSDPNNHELDSSNSNPPPADPKAIRSQKLHARHTNCSVPKPHHQMQSLLKISGDKVTYNNISEERASKSKTMKEFFSMKHKLYDVQSEFMQKFEHLKLTSPEKLKYEVRFITMVSNNECKLIMKNDHLQKMPDHLPKESVSDFKEKIRRSLESFSNKSGREQQQQDKELQELFDYVDALVSPREAAIESYIAKFQEEINQRKAKLNKQINEFAINLKIWEQQNNEFKAEVRECRIKRSKERMEVTKLNEALRSVRLQNIKLNEELENVKEEIEALNAKLSIKENKLHHEVNDKQHILQRNRELEAELSELKKNLAEAKCRAETTNHSEAPTEADNSANDVRTALVEVEMQNSASEERQKLVSQPNYSTRNYENEIYQLEQSLDEKQREIDNLKSDLSVAHIDNRSMKDLIEKNQPTTKVSTKLVNTLQSNEDYQNINLEDMLNQSRQKDNTISELKTNFQAKSEECRYLYLTIKRNEMELCCQENMIKLLEEVDQQSRLVRDLQEKQITRMREEITYFSKKDNKR